jgi:peptide/nickel transport system substrate-binding protein
MDESTLRHLIAQVESGRLSRRRFMGTMAALGLPVSVAAAMLPFRRAVEAAGSTVAPSGQLKLIWWQAPTVLNPYFASGLKDLDACRIFYEPLLERNPDGELVPVLATEVPTVENGGLAADGTWVRVRLKPRVVWHDGRLLTADDVVFNWEYAVDSATATVHSADYRGVERVEAVDARTVKVSFKKPTPGWYNPFRGLIIPRHRFAAYKGARAREAPENLKPVGTGPYRCLAFQPGDTIQAERNPLYHVAGQPSFLTLELKGGGDAVSAARSVLQTGEYDYASNLQVEDDVLTRLERRGKGAVRVAFGGTVEFIVFNLTDPSVEIAGERSHIRTNHPILANRAVRRALSLLVDRTTVAQQIYGRAARPTANYLNGPTRYDSKVTAWEFSPDKASALLNAQGWIPGADGIRLKNGRPLRLLCQTSANAPREKALAVFKGACVRAGVAIDIKTIPASVFFSSDPGNTDTAGHFHADLQMYAMFRETPEPESLMERFVSWEVASKANKWQGANEARWRNERYDQLFRRAEVELHPVRRAALFIEMNDLLVQEAAVIPIVRRARVAACAHTLRNVELGPWGPELANLVAWRRA